MKKVSKKMSPKTKSKKLTVKAKKPRSAIKMATVEDSPVHNTAGARMPDPAARNRPLRKDVRFAFLK